MTVWLHLAHDTACKHLDDLLHRKVKLLPFASMLAIHPIVG